MQMISNLVARFYNTSTGVDLPKYFGSISSHAYSTDVTIHLYKY